MDKKTFNFNMNDIDNMFFSSKSAKQDFEVMKTILDEVAENIEIQFVFNTAKLLTQNYLDTLKKLLDERYANCFKYKFAISPSIKIVTR